MLFYRQYKYEMTLWMHTPITKLDNLSLIPGTHIVERERENQIP